MLKNYSKSPDLSKLDISIKKEPPRYIHPTLKGDINSWRERVLEGEFKEHGSHLKDYNLRGWDIEDKKLRYLYRKNEKNSNYVNISSRVYYDNAEELKALNIGFRDVIIIVNYIFKAIFMYSYNKGKYRLPRHLGTIYCNRFDKYCNNKNDDIATNHFRFYYENYGKQQSDLLPKMYECYPRYPAYVLGMKTLIRNFFKRYEN